MSQNYKSTPILAEDARFFMRDQKRRMNVIALVKMANEELICALQASRNNDDSGTCEMIQESGGL